MRRGTLGRYERYSWTESLLRIPDVDCRWSEPLARHTTFRVGGPVLCLARPRSSDAFTALVRMVRDEGIPHFLLGGGSNILAPDGEWETVVIQPHLALARVEIREPNGVAVSLYAGAGVRLAALLGYCLKCGLSGMEGLVGIPGTVGGGLVMNAGTAAGCIADPLLWVEVLDGEGNRRRVEKFELAIGYRTLGLEKDRVVMGACFRLRHADAAELKARMASILKARKRTQPLEWPSAGCVFKNPSGRFAGALIEKCDLKGLRIGDAQVSEKHANWIVNRGQARASEVTALIDRMEQRVYERFGIRLEREIRVLGDGRET